MTDRSIDPTADQVRALRDHGPDGPIVMVNLLKFRDQAAYPTRHHFLAMMADPEYRQALVHRYAGLERTILLQCGG